MIRGILLDIDGTLLDSNDAHAEAWELALRESGIQTPFASIRKRIGMGSDNLLPSLLGISKESSLGKEVTRRRSEIFKKYFLYNLRPFPGTRQLIKSLKQRGFILVVATSASEHEVQGLLKQAGVNDLIDLQTSSDDVDHSKPNPDIIEAALQEIGVANHEAILIGDTPYDIEAATRAGVATIALRCGGWETNFLNQAIEIYDTPADLFNHLDSSILSAGAYLPYRSRPSDESFKHRQ